MARSGGTVPAYGRSNYYRARKYYASIPPRRRDAGLPDFLYTLAWL